MLELISIPDILPWHLCLGLIVLSCFTSMLTASVGIGGGLLMLATLAQLIPVKAIIPVHAAIQLGSNSGRALIMLKEVRWDILAWFFAGSVLGAIAGGRLAINLPIEFLQGLLGSFILFSVWGPKLRGFANNKLALVFGGAISTFLTMLVGATGPFVTALFRTIKLNRLTLVATSAAALIIQHGVKIFVFGLLGFNFAPYGWLIGAMVVSGFIGTLVGRRTLVKIGEDRFQWCLNIALSLLAIRLIYITLI